MGLLTIVEYELKKREILTEAAQTQARHYQSPRDAGKKRVAQGKQARAVRGK